ncbi:MAG: hypothetical protein WCS03_08030 [Bacteroidota bacterium]
MKKLLIILAIVAIASTKSFAYTHYGFVESPENGYQNAKTYSIYPGYYGVPYISYVLYVYHGGAYIGTESGTDQISSSTGEITKYGSFNGYFSYVYMSACNLGEGGYAHVIANW